MITPLEALERYGYHCNHYVNGEKDYKIIETHLKVCEARIKFLEEREKEAEKKLKALEIIKNKRVNVRAFLKCCHREDGLTIYNNQCDDKQEKESKELTPEEFELLKEVIL